MSASAWGRVRATWDRLAIYLPVMLMGVLALGTYWLARNTPTFSMPGIPLGNRILCAGSQ